jgi:hypothetical protein
MKSADSAYSGTLLIEIRDGPFFLMGLHGPLDSHVTVDFLTNEKPYIESRVAKSKNLL